MYLVFLRIMHCCINWNTKVCVFGSLPFHLKVLRVHLVPQRVGPAHRPQRRGHPVWVVEVFHQRVDGSHDSISVFSELDTSLHLLRLLDVLEVLEKLLGWGEIYKQPAKKKKKRLGERWQNSAARLISGSSSRKRRCSFLLVHKYQHWHRSAAGFLSEVWTLKNNLEYFRLNQCLWNRCVLPNTITQWIFH